MSKRIETRTIRKVYVGGKKEEAILAAKCGFIGHIMECAGGGEGNAIQAPDRESYNRARAAYYLRFPSHPGHPIWRPNADDQFALDLNDLGEAAYLKYQDVLISAVEKWRAINKHAKPVHPLSIDWDAKWETLKDDTEQLWRSRHQVIVSQKAELKSVPGLFDAVMAQIRRFTGQHCEEIVYANNRAKRRARGR